MSKELGAVKSMLQKHYELLCCINQNTSQTSIEIASQIMEPSFVTGETSTGTVAAGARSVTFFNTGAGNVTVAGGTLIPGTSITMSAGGESDVLTAITYDATGSSLDYLEIRPQ
jgi:hypothetical protein